MSDQTYLNTAQAAERLQCSPRYLVNLRLKGGGPKYVKLSHKLIRYRASDVDAWAAEHLASSTSEERGK